MKQYKIALTLSCSSIINIEINIMCVNWAHISIVLINIFSLYYIVNNMIVENINGLLLLITYYCCYLKKYIFNFYEYLKISKLTFSVPKKY